MNEEDLITRTKSKQNRFLVFSSFGNNSNILSWLSFPEDKNYDLWLTYYGDSEHVRDYYAKHSDYFNIRKGYKFPNFHYIYNKYPDIINRYEAICLLDDDIIINTTQIKDLFHTLQNYNLWLIQPSFLKLGKISHKWLTTKKVGPYLRFVNFIEMNTPFFSQYAIKKFMAVYNPKYFSMGIDYWIMHVLGKELKNKYVIMDSVAVINPEDELKSGERELFLTGFNQRQRVAQYTEIKNMLRINGFNYKHLVYKEFNSTFGIREFIKRKNDEQKTS